MELKEQKELIRLKKEEYNKAIEDEEDRIEKEIRTKFKVEKAVKKAEEEKRKLLAKLLKKV